MRFQKRVIYSVVFALIILFSSMFIKIIPCQTAPVVPNPIYQWTFCNLNPDSNTEGITRLYLGYTPSIRGSYMTILIISFLLAMLILHFIVRTKRE